MCIRDSIKRTNPPEWLFAVTIMLVLATIYRFRGSGIIHRNARVFIVLSWVLTGIVVVSGFAIFYCGITGDYCILTGWDNQLDNVLAGLLLIAGGLVCGWANLIRADK